MKLVENSTCTRINGARHLLSVLATSKGAFHTRQTRSANRVMSIALAECVYAIAYAHTSFTGVLWKLFCVSGGSKNSNAKHPQSDDERRKDKRQNLYELRLSSPFCKLTHTQANTHTHTLALTTAGRCRFDAHGRTPFGGSLVAAPPCVKHY